MIHISKEYTPPGVLFFSYFTNKGGSINYVEAILKFIFSRLLCGRREQCGHCDRLTSSKMQK